MADNVQNDLSQLKTISHNEFGDQRCHVMPISRRITNHQQSLLALLASSKHFYFMNPYLHAF